MQMVLKRRMYNPGMRERMSGVSAATSNAQMPAGRKWKVICRVDWALYAVSQWREEVKKIVYEAVRSADIMRTGASCFWVRMKGVMKGVLLGIVGRR